MLSHYVGRDKVGVDMRKLACVADDGRALTLCAAPNPGDFALEEYYHEMTGDEAVALLKQPRFVNGDYLFRPSKSTSPDVVGLCLSYREGTWLRAPGVALTHAAGAGLAVRHQRIGWNAERQLFEQQGSTNTFSTRKTGDLLVVAHARTFLLFSASIGARRQR